MTVLDRTQPPAMRNTAPMTVSASAGRLSLFILFFTVNLYGALGLLSPPRGIRSLGVLPAMHNQLLCSKTPGQPQQSALVVLQCNILEHYFLFPMNPFADESKSFTSI